MRGLLEAAAAGESFRPMDESSPRAGLQRSAVAALSLALQSHDITVSRMLQQISEGLSAEKVKAFLGERLSLPDVPTRLRAADLALKLLERTGEVPPDCREPGNSHITVNVLMIGEDDGDVHQNVRQLHTIDAQVVGEHGDTNADPTIARQRSEE